MQLLFVVLCLCSSLRSCVSLPSRLQCLQYIHDLGRKNATIKSEQWKRSATAAVNHTNENNAVRNSTTNKDANVKLGGWVYQAPNCPLQDFDKKSFCTQAIGCGKKILLVGDSTLQAWMGTLRLLLGAADCSEEAHTSCPAHSLPHCVFAPSISASSSSSPFTSKAFSKCDPKTHWGMNTVIRDLNACTDSCSQNNSGVHVTFIRHDFLHEVHGRRWYKDSVCHYWWEVAMEYDYVVLSFGPHLEAVLDNPYTSLHRRHRHQDSDQKLLQETASAFTHRLVNLYELSNATKKPLLLYRSGPVGVGNYSRHCDEPPLEHLPEITDAYDWPLIPLVNSIYIKSLLKSFSTASLASSLLIMDTSALMSKIKSCRADFMHFRQDEPSNPVTLELQIFFNILSEHHRNLLAQSKDINIRKRTASKEKSVDKQQKHIYLSYYNHFTMFLYVVVCLVIVISVACSYLIRNLIII